LIELFVRKKSEFIETSVSKHFRIVEWKLFEEQVNGGLRDICEPMHQGVPYNTDLNTGARINVGLDVIATLSRHYGIQCPIFIDNAESITDFIDFENQAIHLVAVKDLQKLKISRIDAEKKAVSG
jgi:exonuclease SbcC